MLKISIKSCAYTKYNDENLSKGGGKNLSVSVIERIM
jgi:hypothetical protein